MRDRYYILKDKIPVPVNVKTWGHWLQYASDARIVAQEYVGPYWISSVFLGLDMSFLDEGPPLLFESMVFDTRLKRKLELLDRETIGEDIELERTPTWELCLEAHQALVAKYKEELQ